MLKQLVGGCFGALLAAGSANAQPCAAYPHTFTSGTTAVASQINDNFSSILNCANTSLAPLSKPTFVGPITTDSSPTGGNALLVEGSTADLDQGGQVLLYNTGAGVPTPKKYIRIDSVGDLQFVNSTYAYVLLTMPDAGGATFRGTVTAAGFNVGANSLGSGANGSSWTTLAGNLIIEGGQTSCTPAGTAVTWPHAFPTSVISVTVSAVGAGPSSATVVSVNAASLTGATFYVSTTAVQCDWMALGK